MNRLIDLLEFLLTHQYNLKCHKYKRHLEQVLKTIFVMSVDKVKLSLREETTIATHIKELIPVLDKYIFCLGNQFDPNRGKDNLILRSGIQFVLDDLQAWPTNEGCLKRHLQLFVEGDCLKTFDKALQQWKEDPPSLAYDVLVFTEAELTRPPNVPTSHVWWC